MAITSIQMPTSKHLLAICLSLAVSFTIPSCRIDYRPARQLPDEVGLTRQNPVSVVEIYWQAALRNDVDTIKQIVGPFPDSMRWECRESSKPDLGNRRFEINTSEPFVETIHTDKLDEVLMWANTLRIAKQDLTHYDVTKKELNGESKVTIRPKDSPNPSNSFVFFMQKVGDEWKIVDLLAEDHLRFVGNKKYAEKRECTSDAKRPGANKK